MSLPIYIFLAFIISLVELKRKKIYKFDFMFFINLYFFLVYVLVPIIMLIGDANELVDGKLSSSVHYFGGVITPVLLIVSYILILTGYYFKPFRRNIKRLQIQLKFSQANLLYLNYFSLIVVSISIFLYVNSFGGYIQTVYNAESIRNQAIGFTNKMVFTKTFWGINSLILMFSFYKIYLDKNKNCLKYKIVFFSSFLLFLLMIPLNSGRGFILFTLLNLYFVSAIYTEKYHFKTLTLFTIFGFLVVKFGDPFFYSIPIFIKNNFDSFLVAFQDNIPNNSYNENFLYKIIDVITDNASHPIISLETSLALSPDQVPFRYFSDSFIAIFSILPEKLLNISLPNDISYLNTLLIWGRERGAIPPGIIAYFYYSLGVIGVLIGSFIYGLFAGGLQEFFNNNKYIILMYLLAFIYGEYIFTGDPYVWISSNLWAFLVILFFLLNSRFFIQKDKICQKSH